MNKLKEFLAISAGTIAAVGVLIFMYVLQLYDRIVGNDTGQAEWWEDLE
jgi:hypothetical protein